jgi:predicted RNA-binding protein with PUA domain
MNCVSLYIIILYSGYLCANFGTIPDFYVFWCFCCVIPVRARKSMITGNRYQMDGMTVYSHPAMPRPKLA